MARARRAAEALAPQVLIGRSAELAALEDFAGSGYAVAVDPRGCVRRQDSSAGLVCPAPARAASMSSPVSCGALSARTPRTTPWMCSPASSRCWPTGVATFRPSSCPNGPTTSPICWRRPPAPAPSAAAVCSCSSMALTNTTPRPRALTWPLGCPTPVRCLIRRCCLVASRAGADVHLPGAHPLFGHVQRITASEAATEIRRAAHAELERALRTPGRFVFPLVCCPGGRRRRADGQ